MKMFTKIQSRKDTTVENYIVKVAKAMKNWKKQYINPKTKVNGMTHNVILQENTLMLKIPS